MSILPPNYTMVPNVVLDNMRLLSDAELRVVMFLCRHTFGWHVAKTKQCSLSYIATATGMSDQGVLNAVNRLTKTGAIGREKSGLSYVYWLNVDEQPPNGVGRLTEANHPTALGGPPNGVGNQPPNGVGTIKERVQKKHKQSTCPEEKTRLELQAAKIYDTYPRKVGRPKALTAIIAKLKQHDGDKVLEATQAFARAWAGAPKEDLTFCPHPATWFNQERFNDDPSTWRRENTNGHVNGDRKGHSDVW